MPASWGIAPDANKNGTTPEDIQRIIAAQYLNDGIIDGCQVSGTATMQYTVKAGAVVITTGTDMAVLCPVPATTVPTVAAPPTGSRTDTIYVKQMFPTTDGSSQAVVAVTSGAAPSNSVVLDKRVVNAKTTATTSTTSTYDKRYARQIGSSLGILSSAGDTDNTTVHHVSTNVKKGVQRFVVPTDRKIGLRMTTTMSRCKADGVPQQGVLPVVCAIEIYLDNQLIRTFHRQYTGYAAETVQFETSETVGAGAHTAHYVITPEWQHPDVYVPNEYWRTRHGGTQKYHGSFLTVTDEGVSE